MEGYLEIVIASFINLKSVSFNPKLYKMNWSYSGEITGTIFSCLGIVSSFLMPVAFMAFVFHYRIPIQTKDFKDNKYSAIYEEQRKESMMSLMYHTIFLLRRLIFGMTIAFLIDYMFAQLMIMILMSFLINTYTGYYRPFKDDFINTLEVFNESTILACLFCCLAFTDYVSDETVKQQMGLVVIGIVILNVTLNLIYMMKVSLSKILKKCKERLRNKKA